MLVEEQNILLSEEEIANPHEVIRSFFEVFALTYSLREIWDMLDCVIVYKQEGFKKIDLLLEYECLRALLEAAWLLHTHSTNEKEETH